MKGNFRFGSANPMAHPVLYARAKPCSVCQHLLETIQMHCVVAAQRQQPAVIEGFLLVLVRVLENGARVPVQSAPWFWAKRSYTGGCACFHHSRTDLCAFKSYMGIPNPNLKTAKHKHTPNQGARKGWDLPMRFTKVRLALNFC